MKLLLPRFEYSVYWQTMLGRPETTHAHREKYNPITAQQYLAECHNRAVPTRWELRKAIRLKNNTSNVFASFMSKVRIGLALVTTFDVGGFELELASLS